MPKTKVTLCELDRVAVTLNRQGPVVRFVSDAVNVNRTDLVPVAESIVIDLVKLLEPFSAVNTTDAEVSVGQSAEDQVIDDWAPSEES